MGSYKESKIKFPNGMKSFSEKVHEKGMTFGIWVCPQNVDAARERSGEIPDSFFAKINGEKLHCDVQPLSLTTQLCMGNPDVEEWLYDEISRFVEEWHVDWIKWDPSATVSFCCNREDHGHTAKEGVAANVEARYRIMKRLTEKFPRLRGWECIYDMRVARTNPVKCSNVLFPEYTNIFMTGPMVGPHVWGGYEYAKGTSESQMAMPAGRYYEISYLDYFFRTIMSQGGFSMGNITGMLAQRLMNAPHGFNDSYKRNLMRFKEYRPMFREDIYRMGLLDRETDWHAVQYVTPDMNKAVVFIFRDGGDCPDNRLKIKALDPGAVYEVASQNERPGKEKYYTGKQLMEDGIDILLPHPALAHGNYNIERLHPSLREEFSEQLIYGSDVLDIKRADA